jgi:hypothetical protein
MTDSARCDLTRRDFLKTGETGLVAVSLAGCDLLSTEPVEKGGGSGQGAAGRKGKEAPQLTEMVKNGELPPVEERLPEEPMVAEPVDKIGQYGGEWNSALLGPADTAWLLRTIAYDYLTRWQPEVEAFSIEEIIPNITEDFQVNDEGTEFTFTLRRGIKCDDLLFAKEKVAGSNPVFRSQKTPESQGKRPSAAVAVRRLRANVAAAFRLWPVPGPRPAERFLSGALME